ncbi:hypothetical protein SRHO_G00091300 [Serrasalmus rhombeus]
MLAFESPVTWLCIITTPLRTVPTAFTSTAQHWKAASSAKEAMSSSTMLLKVGLTSVDPDLLVFGKHFTSNYQVLPNHASSRVNISEPFASDKRQFNRPHMVPSSSTHPATSTSTSTISPTSEVPVSTTPVSIDYTHNIPPVPSIRRSTLRSPTSPSNPVNQATQEKRDFTFPASYHFHNSFTILQSSHTRLNKRAYDHHTGIHDSTYKQSKHVAGGNTQSPPTDGQLDTSTNGTTSSNGIEHSTTSSSPTTSTTPSSLPATSVTTTLTAPTSMEDSQPYPNDTKGYISRNITTGDNSRPGGDGGSTPVWHLAANTVLVALATCATIAFGCCCSVLMAVSWRGRRRRKGRYRTTLRGKSGSMRLIKYVIVRESS